MNAALTREVQNTFGGRVFLFETANGTPYDRRKLSAMLRDATGRILGYELGPHAFRHAFASHMIEDHPHMIDAIMRKGGWENAQTFIRTYLHHRLPGDGVPDLPVYTPRPLELGRYSAAKQDRELARSLKNEKRRLMRARLKEENPELYAQRLAKRREKARNKKVD